MKCVHCQEECLPTMTKWGLRWDCKPCSMWCWGSQGHPVDKATHDARQEAHRSFDPIWHMRLVDRNKAYELLAEILGIPKDKCHMKLMDRETALRVPGAVQEIREKLNGEKKAG